jgi:uncharacterized membrane protein YbhN (UPF0104 family)
MATSPRALVNILVPALLLAVAAWVLWRELHELPPARIAAAAASLTPVRLAAAAVLSLAGYVLLGVNEQIALRWLGSKVSWRRGIWASFVAHALANSLGMAALVGGAVRVGMLARDGVSVAQSAVVTVYAAVSFGLGLAALAGLSFLVAPPEAFAALHAPAGPLRLLGGLLVAGPFAYLAACALVRGRLVLFGHELSLPPLWLGLTQFGFGLSDVILAAVLMWLVLPGEPPPLANFAGAYLTAMAAGLFSGVPGGLGVFEGALVALLPQVDRANLAAAMLAYRIFFYLLPLAIAAPPLAAGLFRRGRNPAKLAQEEDRP